MEVEMAMEGSTGPSTEEVVDTLPFSDDLQTALEPRKLVEDAVVEASLDDFGDDQFVEPLTNWLRALRCEAQLTELGTAMWSSTIRGFLVNRLRFQDDVKRYPEILDEVIEPPIVIVGLPRTGTTKLQRMLSSDPGVQKLALWRMMNPAPLSGWTRNGADPRVALADEHLRMLVQQFPDFMAAHPTQA